MSPKDCKKGDLLWCYICGKKSKVETILSHVTRSGHLSVQPLCPKCDKNGRYAQSVSIIHDPSKRQRILSENSKTKNVSYKKKEKLK
jgi:hypothetical protein